jgi:predicted DNA-binding WGR domain protein
MTRRFEFVGGTSAKFLEVTLAGTSVTVRYGRIGTDGQMQAKTFPSPEAARQHAEKLVSQKTRKGYRECAVR